MFMFCFPAPRIPCFIKGVANGFADLHLLPEFACVDHFKGSLIALPSMGHQTRRLVPEAGPGSTLERAENQGLLFGFEEACVHQVGSSDSHLSFSFLSFFSLSLPCSLCVCVS